MAKRAELYELRIYESYYVAVAPYTNREQGLASLMGYIEGGNEDERGDAPLEVRVVLPGLPRRTRLRHHPEPVLEDLAVGILLEQVVDRGRARAREAQDEDRPFEGSPPRISRALELLATGGVATPVAHDLVVGELDATYGRLLLRIGSTSSKPSSKSSGPKSSRWWRRGRLVQPRFGIGPHVESLYSGIGHPRAGGSVVSP